eukprot:scaffold178069_cov35-Prasinocladus_malaysianus.AAC.1
MTCDETEDILRGSGSADRNPLQTIGKPTWMTDQNSMHAHGADSSVAELYTREAAELAESFLSEDLERWGYAKMEFDEHGRPLPL